MMSLLLHLQVRGQASARELARQLDVSERTVQRVLEELRRRVELEWEG